MGPPSSLHHRAGSGPPWLRPAGPTLFCFGVQGMPALGAEAMERRVCRRGTKAGSCSGEGGSGSAETTGASSMVWGERCWAGGDTHSWVWGVTGDPVTVQGQTCVPHLELQPRVANGRYHPKVPQYPRSLWREVGLLPGAPARSRRGRGPGRVNGRGYTSARGHGQKVCQWDRMAPTAGPRAAAAPGAIAPPRPGPVAGPCHKGHLHKGRPVAAGRELGKKCLQWEESKYHCRDILIAGWKSLLLIFLTLLLFLLS